MAYEARTRCGVELGRGQVLQLKTQACSETENFAVASGMREKSEAAVSWFQNYVNNGVYMYTTCGP